MALWNQFAWNSGALWSAASPSPLNITPKQNHITRMKRQVFYPTRLTDQVGWHDNFSSKLGGYATALGLASGVVTAAVAESRWIMYVLGSWVGQVRAFAPACTDAMRAALTGEGDDPFVLPVFTAPTLPTGVAPVAPGALERIFALVQIIKNSAGYTEAIGTDLGIVGAEDTTEHPVPKFTLKVLAGDGCECVRIGIKRYDHMGVSIETRRGGTSAPWEPLAIATGRFYLDERPLLVAGQPEIREYRLRYWDDGSPNGPWTDIGKITVSP
ncbi:MAG: hypothetical protein ABMA26_21870 [Limisphaerales bacterium]